MGGRQNYGPLLGRCRIILKTQKVTIGLTTTHMAKSGYTRVSDQESIPRAPDLAANQALYTSAVVEDTRRPE